MERRGSDRWRQGVTAGGIALARTVALTILCAGLSACAGANGAVPGLEGQVGDPPPPARPAACRSLPAGTDLQAAIDAAPDGASLCLEAGLYHGPLHITRPLTLWGGADAVIRSGGEGTTVRLNAPGAALLGVTIDGSGARYDLQDAAVLLQGDDARIEGVRVQNAVFGILVEKSNRAIVRNNRVEGLGGESLGLRGDGIRLWETRGSLVEGNRVTRGRDMVLWYSSGNRVRRNTVADSRYGTHLMFSHDNVLEANAFLHNVVGVFLMYSRNVRLEGNLVAASSGAAGVGLGVKESGNLSIRSNRFLYNTVGIHLDTTPLQATDFNQFEGNEIRLSDVGIFFLSSQHRNTFRGNTLRDNQAQVRVGGGGDALDVTWDRNNFDDYAGYDLDGDGLGDLPYRLRSLSNDLAGRAPNLEFFRGMMALKLVDAVSHVVPLFEPKTILIDEAPRMAAAPLEKDPGIEAPRMAAGTFGPDPGNEAPRMGAGALESDHED